MPTSDEERAERKRIKREKRAARRTKEAPNDDQQSNPINLSGDGIIAVEAQEEVNDEVRGTTDDEEARRRRKKEKKKARRAAEETTVPHPAEGKQEQTVIVQGGETLGDVVMEDASEEKRPKKRRKVAFVEAHDPKDNDGSGDDGDDEPMEEEPAQSLEQDLDEPASGFLPSFPRPRKPRAPSASVLYRQGLDKALAQAEIVEAAITLPLNPPDDSRTEDTDVDEFGLSKRMRKRLGELDITELFAGNGLSCSLDSHIADLARRFTSSNRTPPLPAQRRNLGKPFSTTIPTL